MTAHFCHTKSFVLFLLGSLLFFPSCSKKEKEDEGNSRRERLLRAYADHHILPGYENLRQKTSRLRAETEYFTAHPDITRLAGVRTAWKEAYLAWQQVDMFEFGPAAEVFLLRAAVNTYPADEEKIESFLAAGTYDLAAPGSENAQGFPALDYMLHGSDATEAQLLASFSEGNLSAFRKKYLLDITVRIEKMTSDIADEWEEYRNSFIQGSGADANSPFSKMVNAYLFYYEEIFLGKKFGHPVGVPGGLPDPASVEAYYSPELSKGLALEAMQSIVRFYEGDDGEVTGLKGYLMETGKEDNAVPELAEAISLQLDTAFIALQALETTILEGVQHNRPAILTVYAELEKLIPLFREKLMLALGVALVQ